MFLLAAEFSHGQFERWASAHASGSACMANILISPCFRSFDTASRRWHGAVSSVLDLRRPAAAFRPSTDLLDALAMIPGLSGWSIVLIT